MENNKKKMFLKLVEGCVCDSITVDGIEEIDMTDEQRRAVLSRMGDYVRDLNPDDLNNFLSRFIDYFGETKCDDIPCSCCGDYVWTTTMEI